MTFAKPWESGGASSAFQKPRKPWETEPDDQEVDLARVVHADRVLAGNTRNVDAAKAQAFAKAYLIDFDHKNAAALAFGIDNPERARRVGLEFVGHPLVLAALQTFLSKLESDKIISRERVLLGLLQEANYFGVGTSHSARVAAWSKLAKILGMELPPEAPEDPAARSGVMLIPMTTSIEDWEKEAQSSQAALKADVRK